MKDKLIKIERYLYVFNKANALLHEIEIPNSEALEEFITSLGEEFEMYDGYELNKTQLEFANNLLKEPVKINMERESYHIVTVGIYDWDK